MLPHPASSQPPFWRKLEDYSPPHRWQRWLWEFALFGLKQAWVCLFGGTLLALVHKPDEKVPSR